MLLSEAKTEPSAKLEYVSGQKWDQEASKFSDIIPEQTASFNKGHWGIDNIEHMLFKDAGITIGGATAIVKKVPFIGSGIAIVKWGPVCQLKGSPFDPVAYSKIIAAIKDEYCSKRNLHLTIMPLGKPETADLAQAVLLQQGFDLGNGMPAPERYLVNVADDSETLMKNLDQKWRYNLRKALKNEFEIEIVEPKYGLEKFSELYEKMLSRKQFLDASAFDALQTIFEEGDEALKPIVALVSHNGEVTAGGVFHVVGDMASYMFGATDDRALHLKAGYALHWWVAQYLCENKNIHWYDLGGNDRDSGLHQFKKGFVGKSGQIIDCPPRYHYATSFTAKLTGFAAFQLRDVLSGLKRSIHSWTKRK
ncbi:MAG: peptidoglycan bridge formation glycyltransferase FemA/FemB family protein [Pseudomonadota bacterium]